MTKTGNRLDRHIYRSRIDCRDHSLSSYINLHEISRFYYSVFFYPWSFWVLISGFCNFCFNDLNQNYFNLLRSPSKVPIIFWNFRKNVAWNSSDFIIDVPAVSFHEHTLFEGLFSIRKYHWKLSNQFIFFDSFSFSKA